MTVNSIDPIGVEVSPPPPRLRTRRPVPRARSSSAKVSMFWVERPSRSRVVMIASPCLCKMLPRAPDVRSNLGGVYELPKQDLCGVCE